MTSARIEAATQTRRAKYRPHFVGCRECHRPLSIENQIEKFCDDCGTVTPVEIREGN